MCKLRAGWPSSIGILWKWGSKPTRLAGGGECRLTRFHPIRNFLPNKIYHFSRLSHQTGCLFTWPAHYIESASYSVTFVCSRMLFCINCWSQGFEILSQFSSEYSFHWLQHFFSNFGYQFELIFAFIFAHLHLTWHYLPGTLVAKWSFQTFKRPPSDWLGPKYKSKVTS